MKGKVAIQDVFQMASSAQKSLTWNYYLISTKKILQHTTTVQSVVTAM
jgi:hypothetical protein